jgi:hypothetical protein
MTSTRWLSRIVIALVAVLAVLLVISLFGMNVWR